MESLKSYKYTNTSNTSRSPSPRSQFSSDTRRKGYYPTMTPIPSSSALSVNADSASENSAAYTVGLDDNAADEGAAYPDDIARRRTPARVASPSLRANSLSQRYASSHRDYDGPGTPDADDVVSLTNSGETASVSLNTLPALQARGPPDANDRLDPVSEDDPQNFDLIDPPSGSSSPQPFSLEQRSKDIFGADHLRRIFREPRTLLKFTQFLGEHRKDSVPNLIYYLDALKAIRAVRYANSVAATLQALDGLEYTQNKPEDVQCTALEERARYAFARMVEEDLPAFVTHTWLHTVSTSISKRVTGTLPPHLREASEGLAEVFCLTDPSREDNPIVFASEEFHRTTQYGMSHIIGRNCRFLQGPATNPHSVRRFREAVKAGKETVEVFLNYRRDGSPFMNLLMTAPLRDSKGHLRYFIGAQVDVSGLAKDCADLEGLQSMIAERAEGIQPESKTEIQELSEMLNTTELETVRKSGGHMHRVHAGEEDDETNGQTWQRPRLLLKDPSPMQSGPEQSLDMAGRNLHGKLSGIYSQYLLVRPYPSLRILFTSPSLRVPGILQSPFMNRIGSSERVREELVSALAEGRGVTAKVRWVTKNDEEGRPRWIHCTPLLGHNGQIGVWMIVIIDEENSHPRNRQFKQAPPVAPRQVAAGEHRDTSASRRPLRQDSLGEYDPYNANLKSPSFAKEPAVRTNNDFPRSARVTSPTMGRGGNDYTR